MRYVRIFFLNFEQAFEHRSRSVVWFLIELFNPLLYLLFWRGVSLSGTSTGVISFSDIYSYYFLLVFAAAFLTVHVEDDVALLDIKEGGLVKYLMRPLSYFWFNFFGELPYRVIQGFFAIVILRICVSLFGVVISFPKDPIQLLILFVVFILGYLISFLFKMIVGFIAFWIIDYSGFYQLVTVIYLTFAGFVMPLYFFHPILQRIAGILPFAYIIYYPVRAMQGKLSVNQGMTVIIIQAVWIGIFVLTYKFLWKKGLKAFTSVGQ